MQTLFGSGSIREAIGSFRQFVPRHAVWFPESGQQGKAKTEQTHASDREERDRQVPMTPASERARRNHHAFDDLAFATPVVSHLEPSGCFGWMKYYKIF